MYQYFRAKPKGRKSTWRRCWRSTRLWPRHPRRPRWTRSPMMRIESPTPAYIFVSPTIMLVELSYSPRKQFWLRLLKLWELEKKGKGEEELSVFIYWDVSNEASIREIQFHMLWKAVDELIIQHKVLNFIGLLVWLEVISGFLSPFVHYASHGIAAEFMASFFLRI